MHRLKKYIKLVLMMFAISNILMLSNVVAAPDVLTKEQVKAMTNVSSIPIAGDGSTEIIVIYKRESYKVSTSKGTGISTVSGAGTYKFEAPVTVKATVAKGYTFKQWTSSNTSLLANSTNANYSFTNPAGAVTLTASTTVNPYTITYQLGGGTMTSKKTSYNVETATFSVVNPTRPGYLFDGWLVSNDEGTFKYDTPTKDISIAKGTYGNLVFTAQWSPNIVDYTINHYVKALGNGNYKLRESQALKGQETTVLNLSEIAAAYDDGLIFDYGEVDGATLTTVTIPADDSLIVDLYYSRKAFTNPDGSTTEYEQEITVTAPDKLGYTFTKWQSTNPSLLPDSTDNPYIYKQPAGSVSVEAIYTPNEYTIVYDYADGSAGTNAPTTGVYDSVLTIDNPIRIGYTFKGWEISGMDDTPHTIGSSATTETSVNNVMDTSFMNLRATTGTVTFKATWEINSYFLIDDSSNQGVTFADGVEYHIYENVVLNPVVSDGWFLYPIDEKHPNAIQVKLSDADDFVTFTDGLLWKDSDIVVKGETEPETSLNIKSNEVRKFLIEHEYFPYHLSVATSGDLVVSEPYLRDVENYILYTIDTPFLEDLRGTSIDMEGTRIYNLPNFKEFVDTYDVSFTNWSIEITQDIIDQYTSFDDLVDDLLNLGVTDLYIKDSDLTDYGDITIKDGITSITFDNCITGGIMIDDTSTTIENIKITNNTIIDGMLSTDNDIIQNVVVEDSTINDVFHIDSDSANVSTSNSQFNENTDITLKDGNYIDVGSTYEKDLTITITGTGDVSLTDTIVNGNLTISGNETDATLENITVSGNASVTVEKGDVNVNSSNITSDLTVEIKQDGNITVTETTVGGNTSLIVDGNGDITVDSSTLGGTLDSVVKGDGNITITDTTIEEDMNLTIEGTGNVTTENVTVGGNASANVNNGNVDMSNTDVEGSLDIDVNNGNVSIDGDSHIKGDVTIDIIGDGDVVIDNAIIDGSIDVNIGGSGDVSITDTPIGGNLNVDITEDGDITVSGSTVGGDTSLNIGNDGNITIEGSEFTGDVSTSIGGDGNITLDGDSHIQGNFEAIIDGTGDVIIDNSKVDGSVDIDITEGDVTINGTTIGGDLSVDIELNGNITITDTTVVGNGSLTIGSDGNITIEGSEFNDLTTSIGGNGDTSIKDSTINGNLDVDVNNGNVTLDNVVVDKNADLTVNGDGNINVNDSEIKQDLNATVKGDGDVTITDTTINNELNIEIEGDGNVTLEKVEVGGPTHVQIGGNGDVVIKESDLHDTTVDIDGAGDVTITDSTIQGDLDITVEGESDILIEDTVIDGDVSIVGPNLNDVVIKDSDIKGDIEIDNAENVDLGGTKVEGTITLNGIKILNLSNQKLTDERLVALDMVNKFPQLENLDISKNELTIIKENTLPSTLNSLDASQNQIKNVELDSLTNLNDLDLHDNYLNEIDVSKNTDLQELNLSDNLLTAVDLSSNTQLQTVDLSYNSIAAIDLTYMQSNLNLISVILDEQFVYGVIPYGSKTLDLKSLDKNIDLTKVSNVSYIDLVMPIEPFALDNDAEEAPKPNSMAYKDGKLTFEHTESIGMVYYEYDTGLVIDGEKQIMTVNVMVSVGEKAPSRKKTTQFKWTDGQGMRVSIFDSNGELVYIEDYSNVKHDEKWFSFGKYNAAYYQSNTIDKQKTANYSNVVIRSLPKMFDTKWSADDTSKVKSYLESDEFLNIVQAQSNIRKNDIKQGAYTVMVEPIVYGKFAGIQIALTPTQMALYDSTNNLSKLEKSKTRSPFYDSFAKTYYLSKSKYGISTPKEDIKDATLTNKMIIENDLGVYIIPFVKLQDTEVSVKPIAASYKYRVDTEIYTSINVKDTEDRIASNGTGINVIFNLGNQSCTTTVSAPANTEALAYCKFTTPSSAGEDTLTIYVDGQLQQTATVIYQTYKGMESPDTNADDKKPKGWRRPKDVNEQASDTKRWSVWKPQYEPYWEYKTTISVDAEGNEYETEEWFGKWTFYPKGTNDSLSLNDLGDTSNPYREDYYVSLTSEAKIYPDENTTKKTSKSLKSGYGLRVEMINTLEGNGEHTEIQTGLAMYPEYEYNEYIDELDGTIFMQFYPSPYSLVDARVHYTPIWYPDGKYMLRVRTIDVWTPAGMLNTNVYETIQIKGSMWDDYHVSVR